MSIQDGIKFQLGRMVAEIIAPIIFFIVFAIESMFIIAFLYILHKRWW